MLSDYGVHAADYEISVSTDGTTFTSMASGTWLDTTATQSVLSSAVAGVKAVHLLFTSEVLRRPFSAIAELNIYGTGTIAHRAIVPFVGASGC